MLRENVVGDVPQINSTSFVDPSAIIIGNVIIGNNCYIGPSVVIRADRFSVDDDVTKIEIGNNCGIQDLAVMHVHAGESLHISNSTIINHGAIIHGPSTIGDRCFIGCKSVITHSSLGNDVFVRSNAIIEDVAIPDGRFVNISMTLQNIESVEKLRPVTDAEKAFIQKAINENNEYAMRYKFSLER